MRPQVSKNDCGGGEASKKLIFLKGMKLVPLNGGVTITTRRKEKTGEKKKSNHALVSRIDQFLVSGNEWMKKGTKKRAA